MDVKLSRKLAEGFMVAFRLLLIVLLLSVVIYTVPVVMNHGLNLFVVFFGDIMEMGWPGQFNLDFMGFLVLSGVWLMWRNEFSPGGVLLGVFGFFGGIPLLTTYLLVLSFQCDDMKEIMLGKNRATA